MALRASSRAGPARPTGRHVLLVTRSGYVIVARAPLSISCSCRHGSVPGDAAGWSRREAPELRSRTMLYAVARGTKQAAWQPIGRGEHSSRVTRTDPRPAAFPEPPGANRLYVLWSACEASSLRPGSRHALRIYRRTRPACAGRRRFVKPWNDPRGGRVTTWPLRRSPRSCPSVRLCRQGRLSWLKS